MSGTGWTGSSLPYVTPQAAGSPDAWSQETAAQGRRGTQRIIHAGEQAATPEVAALLALDPGAPVVVRRRIIELDGRPVELTDSHYPAAIAAGTRLSGTAKIPGGAVTLLASLGHVGVRVVETVTARMPSPDEQRALHLGPGEPVLRLARTTYAADDHPIQAELMLMPAGTQQRYEIRLDS
ncbi:UTRA domain-containing protein [Streptomyces bambusae]|uniref:GntR family transcriptional regulator n=1 Tax=Streptomyces bambusae TaxID=1550616 RepID=UPI001CFE9948|nr:UTRA domain-containing protein [Streptomyces bambusae]MCB5167803.1 UTRA domain-containing protein [Streptomyces bambusae]